MKRPPVMKLGIVSPFIIHFVCDYFYFLNYALSQAC